MTETQLGVEGEPSKRSRMPRRLWLSVLVVVILGGSGGVWYFATHSSTRAHRSGSYSAPDRALIDSAGNVTGLPAIDRALAPVLDGSGLLPSGARLVIAPCQQSADIANCRGSFYSFQSARQLGITARTVTGELQAERSDFPRNALLNYNGGKGLKAVSGLGDKAFIRPVRVGAESDQKTGQNKSYDTFWARRLLHGAQLAVMVRNVVIEIEWYGADVVPTAHAGATPHVTEFSNAKAKQQALELARALVAKFS